jgi:hypothetical protein
MKLVTESSDRHVPLGRQLSSPLTFKLTSPVLSTCRILLVVTKRNTAAMSESYDGGLRSQILEDAMSTPAMTSGLSIR